MKSFTKNYEITASVETVWQALTDAPVIERWSGAQAKMSAEVGSKFSLWDNTIWGKNTAVHENKRLVQDWYGGNWDEASQVTITLTEEDGKTKVELQHDNLPDDEADSFDKGWDEYYFGPLIELCERKDKW